VEIKTELEKIGHGVTSIWNIKECGTKLPLSMFFVELKPAPSNKDIRCGIYTAEQNEIQAAQIRKGILLYEQTVKDMRTKKNYCHLKPRLCKFLNSFMNVLEQIANEIGL
jgi:hypothetical protein